MVQIENSKLFLLYLEAKVGIPLFVCIVWQSCFIIIFKGFIRREHYMIFSLFVAINTLNVVWREGFLYPVFPIVPIVQAISTHSES